MKTDYRILHLEAREEHLEQVSDLLKREYLPCELAWVRERDGFQNALAGGWSYDLLLVGDLAPGFAGTEALDMARRRCPDLPVVLLSRGADPELAAEWLRQGAADVIDRSALARLAPALRRTLKEARTLSDLKEAQADNLRTVGLLRTVLESTAEGILVADLAGRITTYNRKFMALCGIPDYVMAPMDLEQVLRFLQDQFADPGAFLDEARALADHSERRLLGVLAGRDQRPIEVFGRSQRTGRDLEGRVFSFMDASGRLQADGAPGALPVAPDLLEAARTGRTVPWYLTEDELVISEKALGLLDLAPGTLPGDLPGLEALVHAGDLDRLREALEHPGSAPFELRMRKGDGSWIRTRWNLKRGPEGYRGMFTGIPGPAGTAPDPGRAAARFDYWVRVLQES